MSELPKNVERGAELLDREEPGWRDYVDADLLEMGNYSNCVLGQVYHGYERGLAELGVPSAKYGFSAWGAQTYTSLTAAWRKVIGRV